MKNRYFCSSSYLNVYDSATIKSKMFKKGVSCPNCYEATTIKQKKGFEERKKQITGNINHR